jgi:hypothetical protein
MRRSVADRRLHGATLSIGLADRGPLTNQGRHSAKGYPFSGGVFRLFTSQEFAAPDLISYSGSRGEYPCSVDFYHPRTEFGSRSSIRRGCRDCSGYGDAARERDRLLLVGVGAAAASVTALDFTAERAPRLRVDFVLVFGSASAETGAARVAAGATCAFGLRPSPSCFAIVERCSE